MITMMLFYLIPKQILKHLHSITIFHPPNKPTPSCASVAPVVASPTSVDQAIAIRALQTDQNCLRDKFNKLCIEFHGFMDLVMEQVDQNFQHIYSSAHNTNSSG